MFHENEDRVMKDPRISSGRFLCQQISAPLVRVKKPGSLIRCFHLLQTHLVVIVVLLAGQASCNQTTTTPSPFTVSTTAPQISVYYFVDITVDVTGQSKNESEISAWLKQVFSSKLENCVPPNPPETTATPTSPQTTPASTVNETTQVASSTLNTYNSTATAVTTLQSNSTGARSTTLEGNSTTAATPTGGNNFTTTATTLQGNGTTTAATPTGGNFTTTATTLQGNTTTTAATPAGGNFTTTATTLQGNTTTTAATPAGGNFTTTATTLQGNGTTTAATPTGGNFTTTATTLQGNTTTTAATPAGGNFTTTATTLQGNGTTSAATPAGGNFTTTATTLQGNTTTTAATPTGGNFTTTATTLQGNTTTTAATPTGGNFITTATTLQSNTTTTAATPTGGNFITTATTLQSNTTTTAATPTGGNFTATATTLLSNSTIVASKQKRSLIRVARDVSVNGTQSSSNTNVINTTGLFQGMEVSCATKTEIRNTTCSVTLKLSQAVSSCCILRTLCAATNTSSDFYVLGKKADRVGQLQNACNNSSAVENSCIYTGQDNAACNESAAAYVVPPSNSTNCSAGNITTTNCNCSDYCSGSDAYYTFNISIQDPNINYLNVTNLISQLRQLPPCSPSAVGLCPVSINASEYKDANVACANTSTNYSLQSCSVILAFAHEVPVCDVANAVMYVLRSEKQISFNGHVIRAAICGNLQANVSLQSEFTWVSTDIKPADFCPAAQSSSLTCQNGNNVVVQLKDSCDLQNVSTTTANPNVTTMQPNSTTTTTNNNSTTTTTNSTTTTSTANSTSIAVNATSTPLNTTQGVNLTTTTSAANVSVPTTVNTTTTTTITTANNSSTGNTTTTKSPTLTTTTTTTNQNASVTTTGSPTTNSSAEARANALLDLTKDVSKLNSSQVNQLVSDLEKLLSGPNVSIGLGNTSVNIVSNLLGASPSVLSESSNRIIGIVDTVGLKLVVGGTTQTIFSPAVALSVKPVDGANFQKTSFSISSPTSVEVRGNPRLRRSVTTNSSIPQGSITLPASLTQNLTSQQQQQVSRVQFNFYQKSTVFQDQSLGVRRLNSGILGASVANLSITGLQDNVIITLKNQEPIPANFVATCVFWDFALNNRSGGWSSNGCSVQNSTDSETICGCNHLTSFAILLDLSRQPITSRVQSTILTFITYIGCGISAIFLAITLLTYLAFGKLRKDIPSKILIQLCFALLLLNLVFLVDAWLALYPDAVGLCISTAWFLHYFLLAAFTWMGLEAVHMYVALVKVFNVNVSHYMLKFSLAGWGIPMIVVIIVIAIDKNNYGLVSYGRFSDGTTDEFCWLKNDIAFYVAVVAYFCVIFLFNFIMFIVVMVQLCRIKRQNPQNLQHRSTLQDVRSVLGITILLGLTWGFAFFAWGPVNLAFMYLFAIFNSLQGFFIFVFHCAVKETVRRQWRIYLCCGKMRLSENSEWSRTATQKTAKKSSLTNNTSLHSSTSRGNNSSSSSFLNSDFSEQSDGIGSPYADRVITADEDSNMDVVLNEINMRHRHSQTS
ncbi:adhesion G-protein coupled receptor G2 isoform X1 [Oreochromis niloticus]|uniref:adhesion G-protein coupled receptor G2 isoform X1 n=1 Tax=Oreochromis niloticus TaxID=8128 RepID=UPI000904E2C2|nr:adhesion G-protein coupled receptor G2 isoform X1 [Oreochromis niloticus]